MAAFKGSAVRLEKEGVVICSGINQKDISFNAELIDATAGSNKGYRVTLSETDTKSVDVSFKGIAKSRFLRKLRLVDNNLLENITVRFANGDTVVGNFMMNSYNESGGFKDAIQFSCDFQSTGAYTHTFSASENDDGSPGGGGVPGVNEPLDGEFRLIGSSKSYGVSDITGGNLAAGCPIYNFETEQIETIIQRCNISKDGGDRVHFVTRALSGDYAISCEVDDSTARYVAITPYFADDDLIWDAEVWASTTRMIDGDDINLIDVGEDFYPVDIVMLTKGKFLIVIKAKAYTPEVGTVTIKIVSFTSSTDWIVDDYPLDLAEFGHPEGLFGNPGEFSQMRVAFDYSGEETELIAISFAFTDLDTRYITVLLDQVAGTLTEHSDNIDNPLQAFADMEIEITENFVDYVQSSYYYRFCIGSFKNVLLDTAVDYGMRTSYKFYESRSVTESTTVYADIDLASIQHQIPPLFSAKLESLGHSSLDSEYYPKFGQVGFLIT